MKRKDVKPEDIRNMFSNDFVVFEKIFQGTKDDLLFRLSNYSDLIILSYYMKFDLENDNMEYIMSRLRKVSNLIYKKKDHFEVGIATGGLNRRDYNTFIIIFFNKDDNTNDVFVSDINSIFIEELNHTLEAHDRFVEWNNGFRKGHSKFIKNVKSMNYSRSEKDYVMIAGNVNINQAIQKEPVPMLNQDHINIVNRRRFCYQKKGNIILPN